MTSSVLSNCARFTSISRWKSDQTCCFKFKSVVSIVQTSNRAIFFVIRYDSFPSGCERFLDERLEGADTDERHFATGAVGGRAWVARGDSRGRSVILLPAAERNSDFDFIYLAEYWWSFRLLNVAKYHDGPENKQVTRLGTSPNQIGKQFLSNRSLHNIHIDIVRKAFIGLTFVFFHFF